VIKVNGVVVTSGTASQFIPLTAGPNTVTILVTAQDGTTTKTYTLTVNEAKSTNDNLFSLKTSGGFSQGETGPTTMTESVANTMASITVTPTVADPTATVTVNSVPVGSGSASGNITLVVGPNTITIVVTAQSSTTKTYTLTVTRATGGENIPDVAVSVDKPTETPQLAEDGITVHQGISPNGDGVNDFLQIDNITNYPDNKLRIMDRNGLLVYEMTGYDNSSKTFDGHSNKNGRMQLPGTYFYELDYAVKGITKHKTGFIILKY
jgi:gliding motility-associated-like protein